MPDDSLAEVRNKEIGFVFQQFNLLPRLTAAENVALPLVYAGMSKKDRIEKAMRMLEMVQLTDRSHHRPNELSGGQCQRVAIARAAVVEPKILFADEPSGNLDSETGKRVTDLLFQLVKDKKMTMIMVTHDLTLAQRCGSIHQIQGGRLL